MANSYIDIYRSKHGNNYYAEGAQIREPLEFWEAYIQHKVLGDPRGNGSLEVQPYI
ncbi:hypothetical protein L211DRAFT_840976 [Terfezia boudieri ATCC MYA-4762]|uniref:Uncharacterized protein n=1 Tax=Terfezia boudieri ATCC MYA-4762 TaxID=1051890 RepID=A0A3N4LKF8_9PEZI|nr:hypothetical protein L211DRAFT_840976 [Terfezia boudieri ATCC MYA-4762]